MAFLDSSVLVASLDPDDPAHAASGRLVAAGGHHAHSHALAEVFSALTGGRLSRRLTPAAATGVINGSVLPYVTVQTLTVKETLIAQQDCDKRGVRSGAIYDWLHLAAARKARAEEFFILNPRDFQALARPSDPVNQSQANP